MYATAFWPHCIVMRSRVDDMRCVCSYAPPGVGAEYSLAPTRTGRGRISFAETGLLRLLPMATGRSASKNVASAVFPQCSLAILALLLHVETSMAVEQLTIALTEER